jgi:putative chitinase
MCIHETVGRGGMNERDDVRTVQLLLNVNLARWAGTQPLDVDGRAGNQTATAIETFQRRNVPEADPTGRVDPRSPTLKALADALPAELTTATLRGIMIHAEPGRVATFVEPLATKMAAHGIDTPLRRAHFLAQIGHESGELRFTEEIASGDAYEGRRDLGNTEAGDGRRFKGRGLIQLTGRANYRAFGQAIGVDLQANPERVATDPDLAVEVACWFWKNRGLNALADHDDAEAVTRRINGGVNGLADRLRTLERARFFLRA